MKLLLLHLVVFFFTLDLFGFAFLDNSETADGVIVAGHWVDPDLEIYIDADGDLDHISSSESAIDLAEAAMLNSWNSLTSSTISFEIMGFMTRGQLATEKQAGNTIHFMYLDNTGEVLEEIFSTDASNVLGFALSQSEAGKTTGEYKESLILINGAHSQMNGLQFQTTIIHEFGHMVGLDHSGIYSDSDDSVIPTMFPVSLEESQNELSQDDISAISSLYPSNNFYSEMGIIKGSVTDVYGNPVFGAHVVAIDSTTLEPLVSTQTGVPNCFTSTYTSLSPGEYILPLVPGNYHVMIESFNLRGRDRLVEDELELPENQRGSGIGIGDFGNFDKGFVTEYFPKSGTDDAITIDDAKVIPVVATTAVTGVDFVTGIDNDRLGSVAIAIAHDRRGDIEFSISANGSVVTSIAMSNEDNPTYPNVYWQELFDSDVFEVPSASNPWEITISDTKNNGKNGEIIGVRVFHSGVTYSFNESDVSSLEISSSNNSITLTIDGSVAETTSDTHDDLSFSSCGILKEASGEFDSSNTDSTATNTGTDSTSGTTNSTETSIGETPVTANDNVDFITSSGCQCTSSANDDNMPFVEMIFMLIIMMGYFRKSRRRILKLEGN